MSKTKIKIPFIYEILILPMFIHFINNLFVFIMLWGQFSEPATFFAALILFFSGVYLFNKASEKKGKNKYFI